MDLFQRNDTSRADSGVQSDSIQYIIPDKILFWDSPTVHFDIVQAIFRNSFMRSFQEACSCHHSRTASPSPCQIVNVLASQSSDHCSFKANRSLQAP